MCKVAKLPFTSYEERLKILELESLELRRLKQDLCLTFSILNGLVDIPATEIFCLKSTKYDLRGHSKMLQCKLIPRMDIVKHLFPVRVVPWWNALPDSAITKPNLYQFRKELDSLKSLSNYCKYN